MRFFPKQRSALFIGAVALGWCSFASANDTLAELPAGRIEFSKTDDIEILSEDLYLSSKQIRVEYRFFNRSDHDVTSIVAFPMPDRPAFTETPMELPDAEDENFMRFITLVDGKAVRAQIEVRAILADGRDVTELLKETKVSIVNPQPALDELGESDCKRLLAQKAIYKSCNEDEDQRPLWNIRTNYFWTQAFPARKEVIIRHSYIPVLGGTRISDGDLIRERNEGRKSCVEPSFPKAIDAVTKRTYNTNYFETWYTYILKTANNWASPIKQFRLVVDKELPTNLVSFCGEGIRKINPTQFEMRKTNFVPKEDLHVLLIEKQDR
jgi:Domain of unknown function (DUF4424)